MNDQTAQQLCELNNSFYHNNAASFSETRVAPWSGWRRCVALVREVLETSSSVYFTESARQRGLSVFDLACGNLRFELFFNAEMPHASITYYAVDNCSSLLPDMPDLCLNYQDLDILNLVCQGIAIQEYLEAPPCDLSVAFGFLHHVPTLEYRREVLLSLIKQTCPGGLVIVSLWQFMNSEELAEKAQLTHQHALKELDLPSLDKNDYILGWQNTPKAYRYCHSFSDAEIDELVASLVGKAHILSRFKADGRTEDLNTYLVMRVC